MTCNHPELTTSSLDWYSDSLRIYGDCKTITSPLGNKKQRAILRYKHYDTLYVHKDSRKGYCISIDESKNNLIDINGQVWFKTQRDIKHLIAN